MIWISSVDRCVRFALILHGPEVLDTGLAQRVLSSLRKKGEIMAVMSGYTGVAAVIDAGLEGTVDISHRRKPSVELAHMNGQADFLLLVNCAKTRESALRFGSMVLSKCMGRITKPMVQIDDGILIDWTGHGGVLAQQLIDELMLESVPPPPIIPLIEVKEGWRYLGEVLPGESVWINGVVVGKAISHQVLIAKDEDNRLIAQGIELKSTGVKRLGDFDVFRAHVRSGITRRTTARARVLDSAKDGVYFIDHSAEDAVYKCRNASLVVTVGDDTSKIAGALLYRFNVPTVAITDGDEDGISTEGIKVSGSVTVRVLPGTDDLVGADVRDAMFEGKDFIPGSMTAQEAASYVARIAGARLVRQNVTI